MHPHPSIPPVPAQVCPAAVTRLDRDWLTSLDRTLLDALWRNDADPAPAAHALGLDIADFLIWLAKPHIQHLVTAMRSLHDLRREFFLHDVIRQSVVALGSLLEADDLAERRRGATAMLRAVSLASRGFAPKAPRAPRRATEPQPADEVPVAGLPTEPGASCHPSEAPAITEPVPLRPRTEGGAGGALNDPPAPQTTELRDATAISCEPSASPVAADRAQPSPWAMDPRPVSLSPLEAMFQCAGAPASLQRRARPRSGSAPRLGSMEPPRPP